MSIVRIANKINRIVYMHLNTRIFPTTGYARVLLFMFIRLELGGMVQDVYFSLHTVRYISFINNEKRCGPKMEPCRNLMQRARFH